MNSSKTTRIISIVFMIIPSLMLVLSGIMKLFGAPQIVEGLTKIGLGNYIIIFGLVELISVALLWIPKTRNVGFFLLCSYLGGALSIEVAGGQPPLAIVFIALLWISVYLRNRSMFWETPDTQKI